MSLQNKIEIAISESTEDFDFKNEDNQDNLQAIYNKLSDDNTISFMVDRVENQEDSWLQATYWCNKLGYSIIINQDFPPAFDDIEHFTSVIKATEERCLEIDSKIK